MPKIGLKSREDYKELLAHKQKFDAGLRDVQTEYNALISDLEAERSKLKKVMIAFELDETTIDEVRQFEERVASIQQQLEDVEKHLEIKQEAAQEMQRRFDAKLQPMMAEEKNKALQAYEQARIEAIKAGEQFVEALEQCDQVRVTGDHPAMHPQAKHPAVNKVQIVGPVPKSLKTWTVEQKQKLNGKIKESV